MKRRDRDGYVWWLLGSYALTWAWGVAVGVGGVLLYQRVFA